jgi:hypothetical protein
MFLSSMASKAWHSLGAMVTSVLQARHTALCGRPKLSVLLPHRHCPSSLCVVTCGRRRSSSCRVLMLLCCVPHGLILMNHLDDPRVAQPSVCDEPYSRTLGSQSGLESQLHKYSSEQGVGLASDSQLLPFNPLLCHLLFVTRHVELIS